MMATLSQITIKTFALLIVIIRTVYTGKTILRFR
jgi:hypothetical protein